MRSLLVLLVMLLSFGNAACAATLFATVDSLSGKAFVSADATTRTAVSAGQKIYAGQTVTTEDDSEVHLETVDGGLIAIRPNSVFRVDEYKAEGGADDRMFMSLIKGAMRSVTGWIGKYNAPDYRLTTPTATIGIRGTDHETTVIEEGDGDEPGTYDTVNEGETVLKTQYGERVVTPEMFAFAPKSRAIAPQFLSRKPNFWAKRKLVIEELVPKRKAILRDRIKQLREDRIKEIHEKRIRQPGERRIEQQEKIRDKRGAQTRQRAPALDERKERRAIERKQAEQRRILQRKEKARDATQNGGDEKAERIQRGQPPGQGRKNSKN